MCFIGDQIIVFFALIDVWEVMVNAMALAIKATIPAHLVVSLLVIVIYIDGIVGLSASMSIQEKIPGKNLEERLASLAVVAPSEQTLHLCPVVG